MKFRFAYAIALAVVASPCCQAAGCGLPERGIMLASLTSVAAPEMQIASDDGMNCLSAQQLIERTQVVGATVVDSNGYVPRTKDDNTPWRFNMNQNGQHMTAEQFDAWMKAKGIHVATGKSTTVATPGAGACQPSDTVTC